MAIHSSNYLIRLLTYRIIAVLSCFFILPASHADVSRIDLVQTATDIALFHKIPVPLMKSLIKVESDWQADAVSHAGAIGLMQLMPATAARFGVDPYDPLQNLSGGARYLSWLIQRYNRIDLVLAAYNAGEGAVDKYGGIPPYPETQLYVKKVLALYGQNPASVRSVRRVRSYHLMRAL